MMVKYRRFFVENGIYFFTLVTYERQPIFNNEENINQLRLALKQVKQEMPFEILGAVILPDHIHFIWQLPEKDARYPSRIGKFKILVTRALRGKNNLPKDVSASRLKQRESNVWQRRYWEHTIRNEDDFNIHLNYIHYNPVKHGFVQCPHQWQYSSFHQYVKEEIYPQDWGCCCQGKQPNIPNFNAINIPE